MKITPFGILLLAGVAYGQFGNWGSPSNIGPPRNPPYGKPPPGRPGPYSGPPGNNYPPPGPPGGGYNSPQRGDYNDDPIPPMADGDSSHDSQQLPSKLPILAPNGVVEIYNRVVDDLIRKLEVDLQKKELDPMDVVIRSTPPGPVRVPGYLQKRPYRRPGAALYRSTSPVQPPSGPIPGLLSSSKKTSSKRGRAGVLPPETRFGESRPSADGETTSVRGAGKISKTPIEVIDDDEKELSEATTSLTTTTTTTTTTEAPKVEDLPAIAISSEERGSSEEDTFMKPRSDEFFPEPEEEEEEAPKPKKEKKREESEEVEEEQDETQGSKDKDVDSLIQHYQSKNSKTKDKYSGKKKNQKPVVVDPNDEDVATGSSMEAKVDEKKPEKERKSSSSVKDKPKKEVVAQQSEESDDDDEDDDEPDQRDDHEDQEFDGPPEPGTGGGKRPQGGYYPPQGPPAVPAKPNAQLSGLSRIRRASDVSVSVDARSAVITARLLVGPINVVINESQEPMEKNVKATIPELEAELLLMERHGVVFLQRFTLDRAYGQDVEISIPKSKDKKKGSKNAAQSTDPNHPMNVETRRQTKMAAHISMEVVKLLRSGNLRVNLMRTAQGAMSKLKLPIKKAKSKKKGKKDRVKKHD